MTLLLPLLLGSPAYAEAAPGWALVLPLGLPQYFQHLPRRGLVYTATQVVGLGVTGLGTWQMREAAAAGDIDRELNLRLVTAGSVAVVGGSWFLSGVDASHHNDVVAEELVLHARAWTALTWMDAL